MRFFFRSRKFKILLGCIAAVLATSVIIGIIGKVASPGSGILGAIATPFQKSAAWVSGAFSDVSSKLVDGEKIMEENDKLKNENAELNRKLAEYENSAEENKFYKNFLEIKEENPDYKFQNAKLIATDNSNSFKNFTIDKGLLDGVSVNDPVISENGLIGYVKVAAPTYSNVETILSNGANVGGIDSRTADAGVITGSVKLASSNKMNFHDLSRKCSVTVGDLIVTSGGGIYPKGLLIGKVTDVNVDNVNQSVYAEVKSQVDLDKIKNVMVITYFSGQGVFAGDTATGDAGR